MRKIWVTICICLLYGVAVAQATEEFMAEVKGFYDLGKYDEAAAVLEKLIEDHGQTTTDISYNLGNCYFKQGNLAKAALHYERALKLNHRHEDALYNLDIVRARISSDIIDIPEFFLLKRWNSLSKLLSPNTWALVILTFNSLFCVLVLTWLFHKKIQVKRAAFTGALISMVMIFLFLFAGRNSHRLYTAENQYIVMRDGQKLYSAPDERSVTMLSLPEGIKVEEVDRIGDWLKVELSDREQGWLPVLSVERI